MPWSSKNGRFGLGLDVGLESRVLAKHPLGLGADIVGGRLDGVHPGEVLPRGVLNVGQFGEIEALGLLQIELGPPGQQLDRAPRPTGLRTVQAAARQGVVQVALVNPGEMVVHLLRAADLRLVAPGGGRCRRQAQDHIIVGAGRAHIAGLGVVVARKRQGDHIARFQRQGAVEGGALAGRVAQGLMGHRQADPQGGGVAAGRGDRLEPGQGFPGPPLPQGARPVLPIRVGIRCRRPGAEKYAHNTDPRYACTRDPRTEEPARAAGWRKPRSVAAPTACESRRKACRIRRVSYIWI
jgi:hypothetical protein